MLENSRQALELAWRQGADRVEIDVRTTRDGKPLVLHDPTLNRTTTGQGLVSRFNWEDLSTIRLSNGEPLLLLEEALDLLRGRPQVYLEVKDPVAAPGVARAVQGWEGVIVGSRDPGTLAQLAAEAPHVSTSLLVRDLDAPVERAVGAGVDYLHLCWERLSDPVGKVSRTLMNEVREAGLGLILWHEERPAQLRRIGRLSPMGQEEFTLGIRPEDVRISTEKEENALLGEVFLTEPLGGGTLVHFKFGEVPFRILAPREVKADVGDKFWLVPEQNKLHLSTQEGISVREVERQDAH